MIVFKFLGINGSIQDENSGNTSLIIGDGSVSVLVDVSVNLFAAVQTDIDAVVITHEHIDHIYGLPSLIHQLWLSKRTKSLDIYCPEEINTLVNSLIDTFKLRTKKEIFDINIKNNVVFSIGSLSFSTFKTGHTISSIGLIVSDGINKLVYTCDTPPVETPEKNLFDSAVLIHETNSVAEYRKPDHSSGSDAGKLAKTTKTDRLFICHLPPDVSKQESILSEAKSQFENSQIPEVLKDYQI